MCKKYTRLKNRPEEPLLTCFYRIKNCAYAMSISISVYKEQNVCIIIVLHSNSRFITCTPGMGFKETKCLAVYLKIIFFLPDWEQHIRFAYSLLLMWTVLRLCLKQVITYQGNLRLPVLMFIVIDNFLRFPSEKNPGYFKL